MSRKDAIHWTRHAPALLCGPRLRLRLVELEDLSPLHRWECGPTVARDSQVPGSHSLRELERRFLESPSVSEELACVRAVRDDTPVALLLYHRGNYGPWSPAATSGSEITPDQHGQGDGSEAQRLLTHSLFAAFPLGRLEASGDIENRAEQRS